MTARTQWLIVLGVVVALGLGLVAATHFLGDEIFPVEVGSRAPAFTEPSVDVPPKMHSLADYKGKVVLVNVWATWCPPCRQEMPSMVALYKDFAPRGFRIVAVSVDDPGDTQKVRDFVKEFGVPFDVLHDRTGDMQKSYQTTGYPENFLIGADGLIRKKAYAQDWNSEANRALVAKLLDEAGAPPAASATITPTTRAVPPDSADRRVQVDVVSDTPPGVRALGTTPASAPPAKRR